MRSPYSQLLEGKWEMVRYLPTQNRAKIASSTSSVTISPVDFAVRSDRCATDHRSRSIGCPPGERRARKRQRFGCPRKRIDLPSVGDERFAGVDDAAAPCDARDRAAHGIDRRRHRARCRRRALLRAIARKIGIVALESHACRLNPRSALLHTMMRGAPDVASSAARSSSPNASEPSSTHTASAAVSIAARARRTPSTSIGSRAARRPAVSRRCRTTPSTAMRSSTISRVVPGCGETIARADCPSALRREDMPAFGGPAITQTTPVAQRASGSGVGEQRGHRGQLRVDARRSRARRAGRPHPDSRCALRFRRAAQAARRATRACAAERAFQTRGCRTRRKAALGVDQIGDRLGLRKIHAPVFESAPREFARRRVPRARGERDLQADAATPAPPCTCSSTTSSPVYDRARPERDRERVI